MLGVLAGMLLRETGPGAPEHIARPATVVLPQTLDSIEELRDRSRVLEEVLAALPARPAVERAGTAVPIDTLQAQVQWVDHQLSVSGAAHAAPDLTRAPVARAGRDHEHAGPAALRRGAAGRALTAARADAAPDMHIPEVLTMKGFLAHAVIIAGLAAAVADGERPLSCRGGEGRS